MNQFKYTKDMYTNHHSRFILSPISNILKEAVIACAGIGNGIEAQSVSEYVLQTAFLKMTGASEQKLKCICWEIATYDYEYRYKYLKKKISVYGECSSYDAKTSIYDDLITTIKKNNASFSVSQIFKDIDISAKTSEYINAYVESSIKNQEKKAGKSMPDENKKKMREGMTK